MLKNKDVINITININIIIINIIITIIIIANYLPVDGNIT